jgi:hypothetical protein
MDYSTLALLNPLVGMLIPIISILAGFGIAIVAFRMRMKRNQLEHEERMLALEKGLPVPPPSTPPVKKRNPYIWGFVLMAFGLALSLGIMSEGDPDWVYGGLFFFPGAAILIANLLHQRDLRRMEKTETHPSGEQEGDAPPTA